MEEKVASLIARLREVEEALADPNVFSDQERFRELSREHSYLSSVKEASQSFDKTKFSLEENRTLLADESDEEMRALLSEEIQQQEALLPTLEQKLKTLLVPPDPNDSRSVVVELRAGTGGDEAALFVGDCVRMYHLFADLMKWTIELLSASESDQGGYKEYVMSVSGPNVHRFMQYEAGTHRVQRIPETETQGRIHTSAITVAVLMEPEEKEDIHLEEKDLRIDTYRASGAGGQHVNVTDSAVRITHIPTNTVVSCQQERSQHKNKDKAMRLLKTKIAEVERQKQASQAASTRASQVGSGDRSERIRTYNFPQNRVTDHRINLTLYNLDRVMEGELGSISEALVAHYMQEQLLG